MSWILANIVALPILLMPQEIGFLLLGIASVMTDSSSIGLIGYLFALLIMAFSGLLIGAWLGYWQWLALRKYFPQVERWVLRSSISVAIGTPLSWLVYSLILVSPITKRLDGIYFSFWYSYLAFGIFLGLSIGIFQWLCLRKWFAKAGWWIVVLPVCFTLGYALADSFFIPEIFKVLVQSLAEKIANRFPNDLIHYDLLLIAVLNSIITLTGISLLTGTMLDWLLRFQRKQVTGEMAGS